MITSINSVILFKEIPPERNIPYQDRHRKIHARNLEAIKEMMKVEKRTILREILEKTVAKITQERETQKYFADQYRLLNVI